MKKFYFLFFTPLFLSLQSGNNEKDVLILSAISTGTSAIGNYCTENVTVKINNTSKVVNAKKELANYLHSLFGNYKTLQFRNYHNPNDTTYFFDVVDNSDMYKYTPVSRIHVAENKKHLISHITIYKN